VAQADPSMGEVMRGSGSSQRSARKRGRGYRVSRGRPALPAAAIESHEGRANRAPAARAGPIITGVTPTQPASHRASRKYAAPWGLTAMIAQKNGGELTVASVFVPLFERMWLPSSG